jgi:hypothetical protein
MSHSAGTQGSGERDVAAEKAAAQDKADAKNASGASSKLFDLRFLIGGLFTLYGVMVGGAGLFDSSTDLQKSDGLRINLWTGLGMLILGLFFLLWAFLRPVHHAAKGDPDR